MPEVTTRVESYRVWYRCDACQEGRMVFSGKILTVNPPRYPSMCDKCGHHATLNRHYPHIVYKEQPCNDATS